MSATAACTLETKAQGNQCTRTEHEWTCARKKVGPGSRMRTWKIMHLRPSVGTVSSRMVI